MNSPWWYVFYNLLLWVFAFIYSYNRMQKYPYGKCWVFSEKRKTVFPVLFIIFLFTLATFTGGDDENYRDFVVSGYQWYDTVDYLPIEKIYGLIASFVNGNYFLWRIIVYGSALAISIMAMSRMKCLNFVALSAFVLLIMTSYGNTRGVLAYAIFVYGFSILNSEKWFHQALGIALILSSVYFHNSMIIPIALLPIALFRPSKKTIFALLLLTPIVVLLIRFVFEDLITNMQFMESAFGQKLDTYTGEDSEAGTSKSLLVNLLIIIRYVVASLLVYYSLKAEIKNNLPKGISYIIRLSAVLFFVAVLLLFIPINNAVFLSTRYVTMLLAFLYITWPYYLNERKVISKAGVKILLFITLLNPLLFWFMKVYYQSVA